MDCWIVELSSARAHPRAVCGCFRSLARHGSSVKRMRTTRIATRHTRGSCPGQAVDGGGTHPPQLARRHPVGTQRQGTRTNGADLAPNSRVEKNAVPDCLTDERQPLESSLHVVGRRHTGPVQVPLKLAGARGHTAPGRGPTIRPGLGAASKSRLEGRLWQTTRGGQS